MSTLILIAVILSLVLSVILITHSTKHFLAVGIALGTISLIVGAFIMADAQSFKKEFAVSKSVYALEDDGEYPVTIVLDMAEKDLEPFLGDVEGLLKKDPEPYYKVFVIKKEYLEEQDLKSIDVYGATLDKEDIMNTITNPDDPLRDYVFAMAVIDAVGSDPLTLMAGIKNENIIIHPETLMFSMAKYVPTR